ncbi:hypothetical protein [Micromonospora sp. WMMD980]|uniref:hypothetical protein n=1 Tax=Micromonospora sp. WMMD980 TaxID=3016088 RepID=UPI00241714CE|nr:hypothetical protein [Micromonospora sp. WMMD980]MDG4803633.1 hypothetical protein [Micromonospora sp. WMMD980]
MEDMSHPCGDPAEPSLDKSLSVGDPVLGKSRLLSRQCDTCIFAPGDKMHLAAGRLRDLVAETRRRESFIICHSTLPHYLYTDAEPAICRGFADRYHTQALRLMERLWGFVEVDPPSLTKGDDGAEGGRPWPRSRTSCAARVRSSTGLAGR